jgi:hypothetical protein
LSNHLRLGLQSGLFPSGFPTNILHRFDSYTRKFETGWWHLQTKTLLVQYECLMTRFNREGCKSTERSTLHSRNPDSGPYL